MKPVLEKGAVAVPRPPSRFEERRARHHDAERRRVEAFLESRSGEERSQIEQDALSGAAPFLRQNYEARKGEGGPLFEECRRLILHQHVLGLLAARN